jgi:hypothetical protein
MNGTTIILTVILVTFTTVASAELFRASRLGWFWGAFLGFFLGVAGLLVSIVVFIVRNRSA